MGPDIFYIRNIFLFLSFKGTEKMQQKFWIKHYLVGTVVQCSLYLISSVTEAALSGGQHFVPCSISFPAIPVVPVIIICTVRTLKRLTNNSAIVQWMCRRKFPNYKQDRKLWQAGWLQSWFMHRKENLCLFLLTTAIWDSDEAPWRQWWLLLLLLCLKLMLMNWAATNW